MNRNWKEYNDCILITEREVDKVVAKSKQGNCDHFLQLNLQGRAVWIGFKEPFEASIDKLYALYYKVRVGIGTIYMCLGLWRERPDRSDLHFALMRLTNAADPVIDSDEVMEFIHMGESECLALRPPSYRSERKHEVPFYADF